MNDQNSFLPFLELTPELNDDDDEDDDERLLNEDVCMWMEDAECQENLFHILSLSPEESHIDANNHIKTTRVKLFFEELGYLTEEPEPIDPSRDYEAEAQQRNAWRDTKKRAHHIDLSCLPSLASSRSSTSSLHPHEPPPASDARIPQFPWGCREPHLHGTHPSHHSPLTTKPAATHHHRHLA